MLKCVSAALRRTSFDATDDSPHLLRKTYSLRHIVAGNRNEQLSNLVGLSNHRTATRLRQTVREARYPTHVPSGPLGGTRPESDVHAVRQRVFHAAATKIGTGHSLAGCQAAGLPPSPARIPIRIEPNTIPPSSPQWTSRFQCSGKEDPMGDTKNDINARFFYIGRMLTLHVSLPPTHLRAKNQNERDRSGRHELHQRAQAQRRQKSYPNKPRPA